KRQEPEGRPTETVSIDRPWKRLAQPGHGGGGNRTRVRGSPEQNVYKLRPRFGSRPDGRFTTDLPPGQPSCGLAPSAIGSPSVPARSLMPLSRATGRARSDTLTNCLG